LNGLAAVIGTFYPSRSAAWFFRNGTTHLIRNLQNRQTAYRALECSALGQKHHSLYPHAFRHSAAVHLLEAGVEVNIIRAWLGHVSLDTTNRYAEITMRTKQAAVARVCRLSIPRRNAAPRPDGGKTRT
jgi:site-specific recombinase XerD